MLEDQNYPEFLNEIQWFLDGVYSTNCSVCEILEKKGNGSVLPLRRRPVRRGEVMKHPNYDGEIGEKWRVNGSALTMRGRLVQRGECGRALYLNTLSRVFRYFCTTYYDARCIRPHF